MHDPQPQLPFGEQNTLEEIRRLLETQNELLRTLVEKLGDAVGPAAYNDPSSAIVGYDPFIDDGDDEEFWDDVYMQEYDEDLPDPPTWFARHYPFQ